MRILVVRPQPGADATAVRLAALGHEPVVHPLLATQAVAWERPIARPDAIILSSAAAVRHAGREAVPLQALPAHAVGAATATAARAAGWQDVTAGPGTMQALLDRLAAGHYLHLAGADVTAATVPSGVDLTRVVVYETPLQPLPTLPDVAAVLLHSPRTAAQFAAEWDRLGGQRAALTLLAISPATLEAAGRGWQSARAAPEPTEAALLAMLPKAL
ncbi:uroporphyrinogen-III synthase [Sandarakinorhabdus sp. AAP62]|uniref:uroporphyrinogen-III synthase n=1 Tax=Sandarakinorhabdus sp. AAP62 TaxID=1248916 RepID=UPI000302F25D|nr:uroporphyrinogen-III synthase [Sandarakinorhabdus sp. AAP62]